MPSIKLPRKTDASKAVPPAPASRLDQARSALRATHDQIRGATDEVAALARRVARARQEFTDLDAVASDTETKLVTRLALQQEIDAAEGVRQYLVQRLEQLAVQHERAEQDVQAIETQAQGLRQQIAQIRERVDQQQRVLADAEATANNQRRMQRPQQAIQAADNVASQHRNALARLEAQLTGLQTELARTAGE